MPKKAGYLAAIIGRMSDVMGIKNIALLVDEYDLPSGTAGNEMRDFYQDVLRPLKALLSGGQLKYIVMTGCTNINNLMTDRTDGKGQVSLTQDLGVEDLSVKPKYHAVCGYTQDEIRKNYGHYVKKIMLKYSRTEKEVFDEIEKWYDGYRFSKDTTQPAVYNPLSVMRYFEDQQFAGSSQWYVSKDRTRKLVVTYLEEAVAEGSIVLDLGKELDAEELFADIRRLETPEGASNLRPHKATLESLLFQAGYLTIKSHDPSTNMYKLTLPNQEVLQEFVKLAVKAMRSDELIVAWGEDILNYLIGMDFKNLVKRYNGFSAASLGMRTWTDAKDKEGACRFMFGYTLMLARGIRMHNVQFEKHTTKLDRTKERNSDRGDIDIFFQSKERHVKAIIECKYNQKDMIDCMRQAENYALPQDQISEELPVLRVCINFIQGKIERIVGRKYSAGGNVLASEHPNAYIAREDRDLFPFPCPHCDEAFETKRKLAAHKGHHKRSDYNERRTATTAISTHPTVH